MDCERVRQLLLDLGLTDADRRRVADALAHADACADCRRAFGDFDRVVAALRHGRGADESATTGMAAQDEAAASVPAEAAPAGGWESFEQRLAGAVGRPSMRLAYADPGPTGAGRRLPAAFGRWLPAGAAVAASLLVAFGGFRLGRQAGNTVVIVQPPPQTGVVQPTVTSPTATAVTMALAPADVAQKVRTFREVNQAFDGRTGWLLLSGDQSDVGLIDAPASTSQDTSPVTQPAEGTGGPPETAGDPRPASRPAGPQGGGLGRKVVLVRLHLLRGADVVSDVDLVIVPGTTASVTVPTTDGTRLRYYVGTSADDPTRLAVRVEVPEQGSPAGGVREPGGDAAVAVLGTSLQVEPYHDVAAGRLVTPAGAYDLKIAAASSPLLASGAGEGKL